jgi:hypothetical protein
VYRGQFPGNLLTSSVGGGHGGGSTGVGGAGVARRGSAGSRAHGAAVSLSFRRRRRGSRGLRGGRAGAGGAGASADVSELNRVVEKFVAIVGDFESISTGGDVARGPSERAVSGGGYKESSRLARIRWGQKTSWERIGIYQDLPVTVVTSLRLVEGPVSRAMVQPPSQPSNLRVNGSPSESTKALLRNLGLSAAATRAARAERTRVYFILKDGNEGFAKYGETVEVQAVKKILVSTIVCSRWR